MEQLKVILFREIGDRDRWLALVNTEMKLQIPYVAEDVLTCWTTIRFPRKTVFHGVSFSKYQCFSQ